MFRVIVVPLKFSRTGWCAFKTACSLARYHHAFLYILHIVNTVGPECCWKDIDAATVLESAEKRFESDCRPCLKDYSRFSFRCWRGDPAWEIDCFAREVDADLIVLGCHHGTKGETITRLGETGTLILERSACPVLLVPCKNPES